MLPSLRQSTAEHPSSGLESVRVATRIKPYKDPGRKGIEVHAAEEIARWAASALSNDGTDTVEILIEFSDHHDHPSMTLDLPKIQRDSLVALVEHGCFNENGSVHIFERRRGREVIAHIDPGSTTLI